MDSHDGIHKLKRLCRKYAVAIGMIVVMIVAELFVFNMPYWRTRNATPQQVSDVVVGPGLKRLDNGRLQVTDPDEAWVEVSSSSDAHIDYLYFNHVNHEYVMRYSPDDMKLHAASEENSKTAGIEWKMYTRKTTDGGFYEATDTKRYSPQFEESRYFHVGSKADSVKIKYLAQRNSTLPANSFTINPKMAFHISPIRLLLEVLFACLVIVFRPGSSVYRRKFSLTSGVCVSSLLVLLAVQLVCLAATCSVGVQSSGFMKMDNGTYANFDQYDELADALIHGHVALNVPLNNDLATMQNPYDAFGRYRVAMSSNDPAPVFFDTAFKDSKYYVYFGVLPAVVLFVPYKLLTGRDLSTPVAVEIFAMLATIALMVFVVQLARLCSNKRRKVSLGTVLLASSCMFLGTTVLNVQNLMQFYQIPQVCAMLFAVLALSCWVESKLRGLNKAWLAAGSLLMGLTFASRPQFIFASLLALPLFAEQIRGLWRQGLESRQGLLKEIGTWLSALLPFIVAFIPALLYNKVRFGSLLDFGSNYNLTVFDLPNNKQAWTQVLPFLFTYFLQPPSVSNEFPFFEDAPQVVSPWFPLHASHGSLLLFIAPFALALLLLPVWKTTMKRLRVFGLSVLALVLSVILAIFDSHIAGFDMRYMLDFGWLLMIAFVLLLFAVDHGRQWPANDFLIPEYGQIQRNPPLSGQARLMVIIVMVGLVVACFNQFFGMFFSTPAESIAKLWWDVNSWFLFV
ncbi:hypothetical protein [Bifidobacterium sp. ESL0745]|uniref:hypothetical protein n=1 Tax=Bifidobacterium sp. ESL0745 TaxID=2983226 RepID=UPI0023F75F5A|nr:hypothetical protein [Bifidobacterium sp. ESL0745]MDF7666169.1 hypothetical protein [Bifidobacterium sp. ESL0745]